MKNTISLAEKKMLKVIIATDGQYGKGKFENIKKDFNTEFIGLEQPTSMFMDEIDIPTTALAKIKIQYTYQPYNFKYYKCFSVQFKVFFL